MPALTGAEIDGIHHCDLAKPNVQDLCAVAGALIYVQIHLVATAGAVIHFLFDGEETASAPPLPVDTAISNETATLTSNAGLSRLTRSLSQIDHHPFSVIF